MTDGASPSYPLPSGDSEMAKRIREHGWQNTPLGPIEAWPHTLRTAVDLMLGSPQPVCIAWGPELISLYNDGYIPIAGAKHPHSLGQPYRIMWAEIWDEIRPVVEGTTIRGESHVFHDRPLRVAGRPQRSMGWFTTTAAPIRDEQGKPAGLYTAALETTERVLAETGLKQSFEVLFESIDEGLAIVEMIYDGAGEIVDMIYRHVNGAFERHGGVRDAVDRSIFDVLPGVEDHWLDLYKTVARTGEPVRRQNHQRDVDRWFDVYFSRVDDGGRFVVTVFNDITERKLRELALRDSEERQAFLLKLSDILRAQTDPEAIGALATRSVAEHLNADRCYIARLPRGEGRGRIGSEYRLPGLAPLAGEYRFEDFPEGMKRLESGPLIVRDVFADDSLSDADKHSIGTAMGLHGLLAAVLRKGEGNYFWCLTAATTAPRDWTRGELRLLEDVAERTWAAMEHARAEAALRESEARTRSALSIRTVGVMFWDESFELYDVNDAFLRMMRCERSDALGKTWQELTPPEFHSVSEAAVTELTTRGATTPYEKQYIRRDGSRFWGLFAATKLGTRAVEYVVDITERRVAEQALRESEERFAQFAASSSDTLWIIGTETMRLEYLSPAFEAMYGVDREAITADLGRWAEIVHPDDRGQVTQGMPRLVAGEANQLTYRIVRPSDGAVRWIQDTSFPIRDEQGRIRRVAGIASDVTEQKQGERRIAESEARQRALIEGVPQLVWRAGDIGEWTWASPQWSAYTGLSEEESRGTGWLDALHPDDRDGTMARWQDAARTGSFEAEYRLCHTGERRYRWFQTRATPVRDEQGRIQEWLGTSTDVDDLRAMQERQGVLVAELQHRTRNLLGVVRSISSQTMRASGTLAEFEAAFGDRLGALSRVQGLLSRAEDEPITMGALIRFELDALGASEMPDRVVMRGPEVRLRKGTVHTFALALHELATNARKYGALTTETGQLIVTWRTYAADGEGRRLALEWRETGLDRRREEQSPATRPGGYGRELIEKALPYALKARTRYELGETELCCTIDLPLAERAGSGRH